MLNSTDTPFRSMQKAPSTHTHKNLVHCAKNYCLKPRNISLVETLSYFLTMYQKMKISTWSWSRNTVRNVRLYMHFLSKSGYVFLKIQLGASLYLCNPNTAVNLTVKSFLQESEKLPLCSNFYSNPWKSLNLAQTQI